MREAGEAAAAEKPASLTSRLSSISFPPKSGRSIGVAQRTWFWASRCRAKNKSAPNEAWSDQRLLLELRVRMKETARTLRDVPDGYVEVSGQADVGVEVEVAVHVVLQQTDAAHALPVERVFGEQARARVHRTFCQTQKNKEGIDLNPSLM